MHGKLEFEEAGRTYACHVEPARNPHTAPWWWFSVSGDSHRYAPFHASAEDTDDSVRERIVAYYDALVTRRAAPREPWGRRDKGVAAVPPTPAVPAGPAAPIE
jgi:hypothetical protein